MPKRVFWPIAMVTLGLIFLASNLGMLPREFWNLWPIILIVVGLGGLLTSDREEWLVDPQAKAKKMSAPKRSSKSSKKTTKKK